MGPNLVVRMEPRMLTELRKLADKDRRTLSDFVRLMIEDYIKAQKGRK